MYTKVDKAMDAACESIASAQTQLAEAIKEYHGGEVQEYKTDQIASLSVAIIKLQKARDLIPRG